MKGMVTEIWNTGGFSSLIPVIKFVVDGKTGFQIPDKGFQIPDIFSASVSFLLPNLFLRRRSVFVLFCLLLSVRDFVRAIDWLKTEIRWKHCLTL